MIKDSKLLKAAVCTAVISPVIAIPVVLLDLRRRLIEDAINNLGAAYRSPPGPGAWTRRPV